MLEFFTGVFLLVKNCFLFLSKGNHRITSRLVRPRSSVGRATPW